MDDLEELCEGALAGTIELATLVQVLAGYLSHGWGLSRVLAAKVGKVMPSMALPFFPTVATFSVCYSKCPSRRRIASSVAAVTHVPAILISLVLRKS